MPKNPFRWLILAVLLMLVPLSIAAQREYVLRHGIEVVLQVAPRDPRSLFQGDYVRLSYDISRIENKNETYPSEFEKLRVGDVIYVPIKKSETKDVWESVHRSYGIHIDNPKPLMALRGSVKNIEMGMLDTNVDGYLKKVKGVKAVTVSYGIEQFFVPEGMGRKIENTDASRLKVRVALGPDGQGVIKALLVDGKEYKASGR